MLNNPPPPLQPALLPENPALPSRVIRLQDVRNKLVQSTAVTLIPPHNGCYRFRVQIDAHGPVDPCTNYRSN